MTSRFFINSKAREWPVSNGLFDDEDYASVEAFYNSQGAFGFSPLVHLPELANELGIKDVLVKDESARMRLNSFKILGVSYAFSKLVVAQRLRYGPTVVCASEGNHGLAVARVARTLGLKAVVYIRADAAAARLKALEREQASIVLVNGNYDDAVRAMALKAEENGWTVISDTSWGNYEEIPVWVMAGYSMIMTEVKRQLEPERMPDVVIVQAGVGGLACAVVSWLCLHYADRRPFTIVSEPVGSACVLESARAGKVVSLNEVGDTIMAGLKCGEASRIAWPPLAANVDAFVAIDDYQCKMAVRALAQPSGGDQQIRTGPAGACGLGALLAICREKEFEPVRLASGLGPQSRALVICTEGVTDPAIYDLITKRELNAAA